ncbi:MAG TPA: 1-acyl-sn-glycerol-3-phosphate acyltransferase [Thermoanaerobaculia bacterium]
MSDPVTLPLWLALVLAALAAWAVLERLLVPGVRWFLRRRVERVVEEVNRRLAIEIRPFQRTRRRVLIDRLVWDPRVLAAVDEAVAEGVPRDVAMARVARYAREIVPSFNAYAYFRVGTLAARRLARSLYRVRLAALDEAALAAVPREATVVFVMNHRSNMDYVLVAYLAATRTALSYAVGEWARVWPLQTLVRSLGAYFVRRRSGNPLYRRVLERYVQMATESGVPQAIYPEGGLTRDGRLREPRIGLVDYILRGFAPGRQRDVVFVPVGLNYDRVLEDRTQVRELDPAAARPGPLAATGRTLAFAGRQLGLLLAGRWHRFGYACVGFGRPLSLTAWLAARGAEPRAMEREARIALAGELAGELMARVGEVVPVVPVAQVARVFLDRLDEAAGGAGSSSEPIGLTRSELQREVDALAARLRAAGAAVYLPRRDQDYAVEVGLRMLTLRRLVREEGGVYRAEPAERTLLAYYAGSIEHLPGAAERSATESAAMAS